MKWVTAANLAPQPWRNGGGQTRELLAWPPGPDWRLRISLADIEQDGPFSAFAGVERWFAVIEGGGVALSFAGGERELRVGDTPCCFDGAEAPGCRLLDGPTRDLNLMLRGIEGRLHQGPEAPTGPGWRALFCIAPARLHLADGRQQALPALSLLSDLPAGPLRAESEGPLYWVLAALP